MTPETRKYAVRALRAAFSWLVDVRYLAANPWKAVKDPVVVEREDDMRIERALSSSLWQRLRIFFDEQCAAPDAHYWRAVRVVLLLSGDSGLRREEMTVADRAGMKPTSHGSPDAPLWQLKVLGKGRKERTVPVSPATVNALRAHWRDRGRGFDEAADGPLVKPIFIPGTPQAQKKHSDGVEKSYSPNSLNDMVKWAMKRTIAGLADLSPAEMAHLAATTPHAFRHTFGTQAAAEDVPVDVIQKMLGHESLQTTTTYVQAEQRRMMEQLEHYYGASTPD